MQNLHEYLLSQKLDVAEKNIVIYIYQNLKPTAKLPIRDVALATFSSTSFIFKLAKKVGFVGYSELLFFLRNLKASNQSPPKTDADILDLGSFTSYQQAFIEMLEKYRLQKIFVFGFGYSDIAALYIKDKLLLSGYNAHISSHLQLLFNEKSADNLLIVISESGENHRLHEIVEHAKLVNMGILSFTAKTDNAIARIASLALPVGAWSPLASSSNFTPLAMLLFDYLHDAPPSSVDSI
ncbi:RpiR family transcriptional regulator [Erysipelotrichaceae bacterium]|nr:RpiR family transcriptional regulator [Erysipelotrichaceae bacterium]